MQPQIMRTGKSHRGVDLKLTDCEARSVTQFVIPGAIRVHFHTLLCPFALGLTLIPVCKIQGGSIEEVEFPRDMAFSNAQISIGIKSVHKTHNSIILFPVCWSCNRTLSCFAYSYCLIKISSLLSRGKQFIAGCSNPSIQSQGCKAKWKTLLDSLDTQHPLCTCCTPSSIGTGDSS